MKMDIRIIKENVRYCSICNEVADAKKAWDSEQEVLVEEGTQEEAVQYPGVPGYRIKEADDYKWGTTEICEKCMHAIMKGVGLINSQKLTGISLNTEINLDLIKYR